ncbi:anti-sigma factor [Salinisphaera sp. SPP-AMP-43]|uniref:anti-sigma factor n=1 Tax=Salinisphaera sp. SPP-AMP-43 TaxID=3121288 RepID=UPI003C6E50CC
MSLSEYDELDLMAAEYVLGTLEADQVIVFQQRLVDDAGARARLAEWEHRLAQLGLDLDPVEPPEQVWDAVARETGLKRRPESSPQPESSHVARRAVAPAANDARGARRWRNLAVAASVAAVVMAGLWLAELPVWQGGGAPNSPKPSYASVIYDEPTGMSWLVTSSGNGTQLSVEAMGDFNVPSDKMLRMWIKPANGKPHLVGKLPHKHGHYTMALSTELRSELGKHSRIMVSMEDRSRAGTNVPGGKLMWVSPLAQRTG